MDKPRLAHTGLAGNGHDLTAALSCMAQRIGKDSQLGFATDKLS
jgi:hypothetical protein